MLRSILRGGNHILRYNITFVAISIALIILGLYLKDSTVLPSQEFPKKRRAWLEANIYKPDLPFYELSDEELLYAVGGLSCTSDGLYKASSRAYYEASQRLKKDTSLLDGTFFIQHKELCDGVPSRFTIAFGEPIDCSPAKVQRYFYYNNTLAISALKGDMSAQYEFTKILSLEEELYNKLLSIMNACSVVLKDTDKIFVKFVKAIHQVKEGNLSDDTLIDLINIASSNNVGNALSAFEVYKILKNGNVRTKDLAEAYAWLLVSHQLGYDNAKNEIELFESLELNKHFLSAGQVRAKEISNNFKQVYN